MTTRQQKDQVGYVYRSRNLAERCAMCVKQTATYDCEGVVGNINPLGWCNQFERRLSAPIPGDVEAARKRDRDAEV